MPTYFCLHTCAHQGCTEVFTPAHRTVPALEFHTNAIKPNCADGALEAAFISLKEKKSKIACQIYSSLFQGGLSTAVLVVVHLCKRLWPEELWWLQELSGDNHMALRLQVVWEVIENLTSKTHISPWWLSEQWTVTSKTSFSSGPAKREQQHYK